MLVGVPRMKICTLGFWTSNLEFHRSILIWINGSSLREIYYSLGAPRRQRTEIPKGRLQELKDST